MSMVAFLSGLGGGYLKGKQQGLENDRQARMDKIVEDRAAREQAQYEEEQAGKQRMKEAGAPANLDFGTASLDTGDGPKMYSMPKGVDSTDVASSDARQFTRMSDAIGAQVKPPVVTGGTVTMNGKAYGSADEATKAAAQYDAPDARYQRFMTALEKSGNPVGALNLQNAAQQSEATKLSLGQMKESAAHDKAFKEIVTKFNTGGWAALPSIYEGYQDGHTATVQEDGKGGATVTRIGPDGKPVGSRAFSSPMDFISTQLATLDPKLWVTSQDHREDATIKRDANKEAARHNAVVEGNAGKTADAAMITANAKGAANQGKPPAGYRPSANGNLEAIPGGPADTKLQGALNADTAALTGSISSFDRLATAANEVLTHPGLPGITGLRGSLPNVPGSDAANAQALLATLKSQVGFGVLQDMRNNSKTGGALGSVSDAEGKRLEANLAALEKSQSLEQFQSNLKKIIDYSDKAKDRVREAYNLRHKSNPSVVAPPNVTKANSHEDIQKLPSGSLFVGPDGITRRKP